MVSSGDNQILRVRYRLHSKVRQLLPDSVNRPYTRDLAASTQSLLNLIINYISLSHLPYPWPLRHCHMTLSRRMGSVSYVLQHLPIP